MMTQFTFPPLPLARWQPSRDTVHGYVRLLAAVRRTLTPPQKHYWHTPLRTAAAGLTTAPVPADGLTFEMLLDFPAHQLTLSTSVGDWWDMSLRHQSFANFYVDTLGALKTLGVELTLEAMGSFDPQALAGERARRPYDMIAVEDFWQALSQIDVLFKQFRSELREETSPVQLWPHHFDLAFSWFSGRHVPGADVDEPEVADEQVTFGFSTGDEAIPEPYFYATLFPFSPEITKTPLPGDALWHGAGWLGALLPYATLVEADAPGEALLAFLRAVHAAAVGCRS